MSVGYKTLTDIELQMWKVLIQVFGGIFITEAGGGYIYNIFKKKFGVDKEEPKVEVKEEPKSETQA